MSFKFCLLHLHVSTEIGQRYEFRDCLHDLHVWHTLILYELDALSLASQLVNCKRESLNSSPAKVSQLAGEKFGIV